MTTATWWANVKQRAKVAWREQNKPLDPIAEKFYRRERLASGVVGLLVETALLAILISVIVHLTAQIFLAFNSPVDWLVYQIASLYANLCRNGNACTLPYLHSSLVLAADLLAFFFIVLWRAVESIGQPDELDEVHAHLDLISQQIKSTYNFAKEVDDRVDVVVEYQPRSEGNNGAVDPGA